MVYISCFYNHYNRDPANFTFIQFEKYVTVILNSRSVIMTKEQLVLNSDLFQLFKLSLLCTEDISVVYLKEMDKDKYVYGVKTQIYWKRLYFTSGYECVEMIKANWKSPKNPLNREEPKRASSEKKIRKFLKLFNSYIISMKRPNQYIREFYAHYKLDELQEYFRRHIEYNQSNPKIAGLSSIMHNYGRDVYNCVRDYL